MYTPRLFAALLPLLLSPFAHTQDTAPVTVEIAAPSEIAEVIQLSGTITAQRNARLSVATAGLVAELHVDDGAQVQQGDLLLEMDAELAEHQYRAARAAESQATRALADARRRLQEARSLAPKQSIAETIVRDLAAEVAQDEAALERTAAEVGYRQGIRERHRLYAPFAGVISERSVELGEWVTPGQALLALTSSEQLRIDLQVPEDYMGRIDAETQVSFYLGAARDTMHTGKVLTLVPVTDPTVRTFLLRVAPAQPVPGMLPGMSARAELRLTTGQRNISVPRDAVMHYPDGRIVVWVAEEADGVTTATERLVQPGFRFGGRVEIRSGLGSGDQVIIKGNESLRNGQAVTVHATSGG
jgi:RND family efflux transporter MFP subunit